MGGGLNVKYQVMEEAEAGGVSLCVQMASHSATLLDTIGFYEALCSESGSYNIPTHFIIFPWSEISHLALNFTPTHASFLAHRTSCYCNLLTFVLIER